MTNKDSHLMFKVILDKNAESVAYGGCPAFLNEEVDIFLNQAQLEILSNKVTGNNSLQVSLEGTVSNISEIQKLIVTDKDVIANQSQHNEFVVADIKAADKRLVILSAQLQYGSLLANCGITSHAIAKSFKQTYNNIPWVEVPVATLEDDKMLIYVDPILMLNAKYAPSILDGKRCYMVDITYIKKPKEFDYKKPSEELDFQKDMMYEIINRAVVIALENIESQRTQSKLQLNTISE